MSANPRNAVELGALLYASKGFDGLRGLFTDEQIDEWKRAENAEKEIQRNHARMRKSDLDFLSKVTSHINRYGSGDLLVVVPGPITGYMSWLVKAVAAVEEPTQRTRNNLKYGHLRVDFIAEQQANAGRGRSYDWILLHDDVSWRTHEALMPCVRR